MGKPNIYAGTTISDKEESALNEIHPHMSRFLSFFIFENVLNQYDTIAKYVAVDSILNARNNYSASNR